MRMVVVMGVSGSGKTTIAERLAQALDYQLLEADRLHPPQNVAKMQAGIALTDADRWPWLHAVADHADALRAQGQGVVVACSVLKRAYRDIVIGQRSDAVLVYLRGSRQLIHDRMAARHGHFMPPALLDSQLATLEEPGPDEHPIVADIAHLPEETVASILHQLDQRRNR